MLISLDEIVRDFQVKLRGIVHIGAHKCEELEMYLKHGVSKSRILWIEAQLSLVSQMRQQDPDSRIYHAVVSDKDGQSVEFIVTNNGQSSSILELQEHKSYYPSIVEVSRERY